MREMPQTRTTALPGTVLIVRPWVPRTCIVDMYQRIFNQSRSTSRGGGTGFGFLSTIAVQCQHPSLDVDVDSLHRQQPSSSPAPGLVPLPRPKGQALPSLILVPGSAHVFLSTYLLGLNAADPTPSTTTCQPPRAYPASASSTSTVFRYRDHTWHTPLTQHPNQQTTGKIVGASNFLDLPSKRPLFALGAAAAAPLCSSQRRAVPRT